MDSAYRLYLERAQNELRLTKIIFKVSSNENIQVESLKLPVSDTYYSAVISHSYYCIFYCAKAYLLKKNIKTQPPEEHKKTFEALKKLVEDGILDMDILRLYEKLLIEADTLLGIFQLEKSKRGRFTYKKLPQANKEPAGESMNNAQTFLRHMYNLCEE